MRAEVARLRGESGTSIDNDLESRGFELLSSNVEEQPASEMRFFNLPTGDVLPIEVTHGTIARVTEIWFLDGMEEADELDLDGGDE